MLQHVEAGLVSGICSDGEVGGELELFCDLSDADEAPSRMIPTLSKGGGSRALFFPC
jgi:hypothetical protein